MERDVEKFLRRHAKVIARQDGVGKEAAYLLAAIEFGTALATEAATELARKEAK